MRRPAHVIDLSIDSIVIAEIVEPISDRHFIVNFDGALVRVENKTPMELKRNQKVSLRVTSVNPLSFQLLKLDTRKSFDILA